MPPIILSVCFVEIGGLVSMIIENNFEGMDEKKFYYVTEDQHDADDFIPPTRYYIRDALGNYVFFRTRSRATARDLCDKWYGVGKYTVNVSLKGQGL